MSEELKPCPFCGGIAGIENGPPELWYASCRNPDCLVDGKIMHSEHDAIEAWNRRATPPAVTAKPDLAAPQFDPTAKCTPTSTQCPRCNNYVKHCDAFGGAAPVEQASRSIAPKSASGRLLPDADKFVDLMRAWRFANVGTESERTFAAVVAHVDQWAASIPPLQAPEPAPESVRDAAAQRLLRAAKVYTFNYLQDEHEEPELCTCGPNQHAELMELFSAISAMEGKAQ